MVTASIDVQNGKVVQLETQESNKRKFFAKAIIIIFFLASCVGCEVSSKRPRVTEGTIYFPRNNLRIELGQIDSYHIFTEHNRLVHIGEQLRSNYGEYTIRIYDFSGNKIAQPDMIEGEFGFIFAEAAGRILAGERGWLTEQRSSFLYDLDGNLINVLEHYPESKDIGITEDQKYFWFVSNRMRPLQPGDVSFLPGFGIPYNHAMVFDALTGELIESISTRESIFSFTIDGVEYTITTSPPDIPG